MQHRAADPTEMPSGDDAVGLQKEERTRAPTGAAPTPVTTSGGTPCARSDAQDLLRWCHEVVSRMPDGGGGGFCSGGRRFSATVNGAARRLNVARPSR